MKFSCDKCNTRYSIADERVRGRVLKIRCKACNNVITVREDLPPAESLEDALNQFTGDDEHTRVSTAPPPGLEGIDDWYVSFDGEQEGPFSIARAIDRVKLERPHGKECFCWRAGFFVWLPVEDVPEFAPALHKAPPPTPAAKRSTGPQQAVRSTRTTGSQNAVRPTRSTGPQQPIAAHAMPAARPMHEMPAIESDPLLGAAPAPVPLLPTRPEPRHARKNDAVPSLAEPDSGETVSPFRAALQASGPTMSGGAPPHDGPRLEAPIPDSGPVPLPPPPSDDLPIDEASGMVSLSHLSRPALASPKTGPKPLVDTFGGVPVTPASLPTPGPHAVVVIPGAARGTPSWMRWAALGGGVATLGLAVAVVVLMTRKPTVIVVPPAPTLDDGKRVDDRPITIADPGQPNGPIQPLSAGDAKRAQKRPPSSARAAAPAKPSEGLSSTQRNLASLYRSDSGGEHGVQGAATASDGARGAPQISQQAIMAVVTQNRRSLNLCYDRVLKHDSSLKSGRVLTHVKVGISGSVTGVNVPDPQYANSEIGQCIAQTIRHWHFPSAEAEYETEFPIILQAN